jgi:hypothetical protein
MPEAAAPTAPEVCVRPFAVGDRVEVRRNLSHPAWCDLVEADLRDGGSKWVPRTDLPELEFVGTISETGRSNFQEVVRVGENRFWYRQNTGAQDGSGATYIVPAPDPEGVPR